MESVDDFAGRSWSAPYRTSRVRLIAKALPDMHLPEAQLLGLFSTRLLKPVLTHVVITDRRIFALGESAVDSDDPVVALLVSDIAACDVRKRGFGRPNTLSVRLRDGSVVDLGDIPLTTTR
nr:hypothetical protein GCM10020093_064380 [Planobispora longispora]